LRCSRVTALALATRLFDEVFSARNLDAADEIFAEDDAERARPPHGVAFPDDGL